jgi:hypothetical protein
MSKKFLTPIKHASLSSNPTGSDGMMYYNTADGTIRYYNGSSWTILLTGLNSASFWRYTATGGETTLSGLDDSSQTLQYTAGYEQVFLNGVMLIRGVDYTATNGTSVSISSALVSGDYVAIVAVVAAGITNSSITINGTSFNLGDSKTIKATATNALTIGTGLSGTSYDGSSGITIANSGVLSVNGNSGDISSIAATNASNTFTVAPQTINIDATGHKGLIVKAFSGQTANIQEWQNSSGTAIAKIDASGNLTTPAVYPNYIYGSSNNSVLSFVTGTTYPIQVQSGVTTSIPFSVKGVLSQSANLTEWQNSTATILAKIDSAGNLTAQSITPTSSTIPANGLYLPATNSVAISTNTTAALTIDSAQKATFSGAVVTDTLSASSSSATTNIYSMTLSTGTINIGGALTTGTLNLASSGTGATNINIGHTNAIVGITGAVTITGTISASPAVSTTSTAASGVGYMGMPQVSTSTSIISSDSNWASYAGKHIYSTTTGLTHTIPANSSVAFPIGTTLVFVNPGSVSTTIAVATDTMYLAGSGTTGNRTLAAYGMATALKLTSTTWIISGNGLT